MIRERVAIVIPLHIWAFVLKLFQAAQLQHHFLFVGHYRAHLQIVKIDFYVRNAILRMPFRAPILFRDLFRATIVVAGLQCEQLMAASAERIRRRTGQRVVLAAAKTRLVKFLEATKMVRLIAAAARNA